MNMNEIVYALIMDLSKAFDCLNHKLLIAKLEAYDFNRYTFQLACYISYRKQPVKANESFGSWQDSIVGVPQGSILGFLSFSICINDIFFLVEASKLGSDAEQLSEWFHDHYTKIHADKCHLLILGENSTRYQYKLVQLH